MKIDIKYILKRLEYYNRIFLYSLLKLILQTPQISTPIDKNKIKKILILRYDAIGDMIVTLPSISLLKKIIPDCEIHVIASKRNYQIIENDTRISKIIIHPSNNNDIFKEYWNLRKENYDLVLSFVFSKTTLSGIISNLAGKNAIKVNPREENRSHLYSAFFNIQIPIADLRDKVTMLEILSNIVCRVFGVDYQNLILENNICTRQDKIEYSSEFLDRYKDNYKIFYNISSGNEFRKLSREKNKSVIEQILARNLKYLIILIYGPEDKDLAKSIAEEFDERVIPMIETRDIMDLVAASHKADMFITPDTSVVHIAASSNKPVLVLYSRLASFIREWMPYNVPYISVITKEREPLDNLTTDEIISGFDKLIAKISE